MQIKFLNECDFVNYKEPSMFIGFPKCSFKCDRENGNQLCQNWALSMEPDISLSIDNIVYRYKNNDITSAIVCGGLEPLDSWDDLKELIECLREVTEDVVVVYTGYNENELSEEQISFFQNNSPVIVKYGRYRPNQEPHFDEILGVNLASDNQYSKRY